MQIKEGAKKITVKKNKTLKAAVKKLSSKKKTYYVRIRAYKTVGKNSKIYGSYSSVRKVKVK